MGSEHSAPGRRGDERYLLRIALIEIRNTPITLARAALWPIAYRKRFRLGLSGGRSWRQKQEDRAEVCGQYLAKSLGHCQSWRGSNIQSPRS